MNILFIQTGGTIDKDYPRTTRGYAFEISEPAVKRILEKLNPSFTYDVFPLLKKDSMELTDQDRQTLLTACIDAPCNRLIITHGTDTMIETANFLSVIKDKTIVLTGAMRPERFTNSDASVNIGVAIGAVQTLQPGVYVAMHGRVLKYSDVTRDMGNGKFISNP